MDQGKDLQNPLIELEKEEQKVKKKSVSFFSLFRYADGRDKIYMLVGSLAAAAAGSTTPFFMIFFSQISLIFVQTNRENAQKQGLEVAIKFFILGGASWFLNFLGLYCWNITGSRQALRFKKLYYQTLIQQQVAWYDSNDANKLATQISGSMTAVQSAIGEKISILISVMVTSVFGLFYAYFKCWQLSLVLTALLPLMLIAGVLLVKAMTLNAQRSKVSYEDASGIAEQAFSGIKTIKSLASQDYEGDKFINALSKSQKKVIKYIVMSAASFGIMNLIFLGLYSLGFWYGKQLLIDFPEKYQAPTIISTFFCFLIGGASIGQISPVLKNIAEGKVAAAQLYSLVAREKTLLQNINGKKLNEIDQISLKNVKFYYEKVDLIDSKANQKTDAKLNDNSTEQINREQSSESLDIKKAINTVTLDDISMTFSKGKVTAIVGESGSGKSTVIQLLMRYYDPKQGEVYVNDTDIKQLNTKEYRKKIGFVGQEPVLFSMSIADNLRLANPDLTNDEIQSILKKANAWEFVQKTSKGIQTYVGNNGAQLSGGQKQRIAIARAIAKKPNMLILDQATSALDRKNQKQIQQTLNNLSEGNITTVVIAHRLSTIKNADKIIVMKKGTIMEQGTHEELFAQEGAYHELIKSQMSAEDHQQDQITTQEAMIVNEQKIIEVDDNSQKDKEEQKKIQKHSKKQLDAVFGKLLKQSRGNYIYIIIGAVAALLNGSVFPFFNIAFSNIMADLATPEQKSSQINMYCLLFLGVAILGGLCIFLYQLNFGITGQRLVFSLRKKVFHKLLRMPTVYYDQPENTPGGISTKLSQDSYQIHNMITGVIAVICLNFSTVSLSFFFAFYYSWKLTLIVLGISPLLVVSGAINMSFLKNMTKKAQKHQKQIGTLISDTVTNIRTVKSFGNQDLFCLKFNQKIDGLYELSSEKALKSSILQGLSRGSVMMVEGFTFWIAAILFTNYQIDNPQSIYIAIFSIIFAAMGVGQNSQFMPDMGKTKNAGANVFQIIEAKDEFQLAKQNEDQSLTVKNGDIQFQDVVFKYPSRDSLVLDHFSLTISKGQKIGFVGPSGSGKSTIVQLLMRFYPLQSGQIKMNGINIQKYNLKDYRNLIGLVSQEPSLFIGTVKQNIVYNREKQPSDKSLKKYAKIAHAQKFINEWDEKFQKQVGQKGIQVSGGQKQRIALTRCLIRKPKIFLLDEFTSALDADTQRIVFENMKPELKEKTSISIAHRLCTIEDADRIVVMRDGKKIQEGGYNELLEKKEHFYRLAKGSD